jgi:hypothetical protein
MDLNVNFQGLKHNFEKVRGCFYKITSSANFQNYFTKEKGLENKYSKEQGLRCKRFLK